MAQLKDLLVTGDSRVIGNNYTNNPKIAFGTCDTAAATAEKVVTISDPTWNLQVGDVIGVKFTNTNTVGTVKLNVNGTGAIQLAYNTSRPFTGSDNWITGYANRTIFYQYDGTYWYWVTAGYNQNGDTYTTAKSWTAAGTAAKTATCHDYAAQANSWIIVQMVYANTSASALTLNINGQGAKPIYINGSASSASNYTLPKAHYLVFYNGTNYYFRTDGKIQGSITGDAATVNGKTVGVSVPSDAKFTDTILQNILDGSQVGSVRTSESIDEDSSYTIGDYSFAEGYHTRAAGKRSHVEGDQNYAIGMGTHSEGGDNKAIGNYSHAEGRNNTANGENSHTEGSYTTTGASASNAHAEGYHSTASGDDAHAEGSYTEASGSGSHAEGSSCVASGNYSHAEGYQTTASANYTHTEGRGTKANWSQAHAEGYYTCAFDTNTHAEGNCTMAVGDDAHAEGGTTSGNDIVGTITAINQEELQVTVTGLPTFESYKNHLCSSTDTFSGDRYIATGASGTFTVTKWDNGFTVGGNFYVRLRTVAEGAQSHAEGRHTIAHGYYSHSEGIGTYAKGTAQHVEGKWNVIDSSSLSIVGNGTGPTARSNAYKLDASGNGTYAGKITVGAGPTDNMDVATKQYADSVGIASLNIKNGSTSGSLRSINSQTENSSYTIGQNAFAVGYNAKASGSNSIALGQTTTASGNWSFASGNSTTASGDYSHAAGNYTIAGYSNQTVIGKYNNNKSTTLFEVGNGTSDAHANAFEVYSDGRAAVSAGPTNDMDVTTKQYVDAIISSGSVTNGGWVRIGDIQICWQNISTTKNGNSSTWGNSWWATGNIWTYPKAFKTAPIVTVTALDNQSGLFGAALNGSPETTSVKIESYASANFTTCWVACVAIGFWR